MSAQIEISGITKESIVDGTGIRYVLFTQGCPHRCKGCHNPETHERGKGKTSDTDTILADILKNPLLDGVTFSGGEPFCQAEALSVLAGEIKKHGLNIWAYSGYTFEELQNLSKTNEHIGALLIDCDVLVDGKFIESLKSLEIKFRGSKNQRVIDVKKSLLSGTAEEIDCENL